MPENPTKHDSRLTWCPPAGSKRPTLSYVGRFASWYLFNEQGLEEPSNAPESHGGQVDDGGDGGGDGKDVFLYGVHLANDAGAVIEGSLCVLDVSEQLRGDHLVKSHEGLNLAVVFFLFPPLLFRQAIIQKGLNAALGGDPFQLLVIKTGQSCHTGGGGDDKEPGNHDALCHF